MSFNFARLQQANFARWEPTHGNFNFGHPWKQYLKIGAAMRNCACCVESLRCCINSEIQVKTVHILDSFLWSIKFGLCHFPCSKLKFVGPFAGTRVSEEKFQRRVHGTDLSLFQSVERVGSVNENHDKVTEHWSISGRNELFCSRAAKCLEICAQSATSPPSTAKWSERRGGHETIPGNSHRHSSTGYGNITADWNHNENRKNRRWSGRASNVSWIQPREWWEIATKTVQNRYYRQWNNEGPSKGLSSKWIHHSGVWRFSMKFFLLVSRENV